MHNRSMFLLMAAVALAACSDRAGTNHPIMRSEKPRITSPTIDGAKFIQQIEANNAFALDLYGELLTGAEQENHFYSPHSISTAVAMLQGGARGETAAQIAKALHFELADSELHPAFNKLDLELASRGKGSKAADGGDFRLKVANALWGQTGHPFEQSYIDLLGVNYGAGMHLLDYRADPEKARREINAWVEQQTESRIRDLMPQGSIDSTTHLVLTNAIYFNAAWDTPFAKSATRPLPFHTGSGADVDVPMMYASQEQARYASGQGYEAAEVPYDGEELAMVIIVPDSLASFEQGIGDKVKEAVAALQPTTVDLTMPKLKLETKYDSMSQALKALGMVDAFSDGVADFSGIDGGAAQLSVSKVVHKAFCEINEEGTEAAAATGIGMDGGVSMPPERVTMVVDSPYVFIIRDRMTGAFLFIGRVVDPS